MATEESRKRLFSVVLKLISNNLFVDGIMLIHHIFLNYNTDINIYCNTMQACTM